jgi:hypothetical protein
MSDPYTKILDALKDAIAALEGDALAKQLVGLVRAVEIVGKVEAAEVKEMAEYYERLEAYNNRVSPEGDET